MRYLAIDLGDKRTGLALGDDQTRLVTPLDVLEVPISADEGQQLLRALTRAIDVHVGLSPRAAELVVGLPLNMDGTEGPRAKGVRAFAERIRAATGMTIHLHDERLTSAAAEWTLNQSGLTRDQKKRRRDALAAAQLLRTFLNPDSGAPMNDDTDDDADE
ncbi:MAG: Holliday junction resolvase RuvX [Planctomycetota bacterium]|nr:Holliday junction resolvase RuvX [Planctomycetota bacterium]